MRAGISKAHVNPHRHHPTSDFAQKSPMWPSSRDNEGSGTQKELLVFALFMRLYFSFKKTKITMGELLFGSVLYVSIAWTSNLQNRPC